ncbi:MAG: acetyl-CoA carboxylase biotin carboxyl carrier protein subunit [Bacteroidales bacterium]|jgi:biotin carboxyl carrier protein|nr:acetyl-CoA carboxylase biotin carboxyl carrier protein subunit [Bacteroidales bacterium]
MNNKNTTVNTQIETFDTLNIDGTAYTTRLSPMFKHRTPWQPPDPGHIASFIPGAVAAIAVHEGQEIEEGDELITIEAMKMKIRIKSPISGTVKKIHVHEGDKIPKGATLFEIE